MTSARIRINDPSNSKLDSHYNMVTKNTSHKLCNTTTTRLLKIDNREILLTDTVGFMRLSCKWEACLQSLQCR